MFKNGSSDYYSKRNLFNFANLHSLDQVIETPTRITEASETIDLIFVNNNHRIVDNGVVHCSISDHSLVYCIMKAGVPRAVPKIIEHRSYKNYNKEAFIRDLNEINWDQINEELNVEVAINLWNDLFIAVADQHAPIKQTRVKGFPVPW